MQYTSNSFKWFSVNADISKHLQQHFNLNLDRKEAAVQREDVTKCSAHTKEQAVLTYAGLWLHIQLRSSGYLSFQKYITFIFSLKKT